MKSTDETKKDVSNKRDTINLLVNLSTINAFLVLL